MRKLFCLVILYLGITVAYGEEPPLNKVIQEQVTALMQEQKIPGVAVLMYVNGAPYSYFLGYADPKKKLPISKYTIFELGSLTKLMTAIIFAEEVDYAKVQMSSTLGDFFDNLPQATKKIRLQDLATHTSGFPFELAQETKDVNELISTLASTEIDDKANRWRYSNLGITLLAQVLEKETHRTFVQLYRSRIINPLGMQMISISVPKNLLRFYAVGHDKDGAEVPTVSMGAYVNATSLKASASDMQRFLSAVIGLPGTPLRLLYPIRLTQSAYIQLPIQRQGLVWDIYPLDNKNREQVLQNVRTDLGPMRFEELDRPIYNGNALIEKTGTTKGFKAYIGVIPNEKTGVVLLMNKNIDTKTLVIASRKLLLTALDQMSSAVGVTGKESK